MPDEWITDRADDLHKVHDLWKLIGFNLLPAAIDAVQHVQWFNDDLNDYTGPALIEQLEAKYRAGEAKYKREWLTMPPERFSQEIREEILDLVLYLAMRRTRWVLSEAGQSFTTNTDPGDEDDGICGVAV